MKLPRALPHLEGARGRVVRIAYLLFALPVIAAVAFGLWFATTDMIHNVPETVRYGFRTHTVVGADAGHRIGSVSPVAAAAGVPLSGRVAAIDGVPVRAGATEFELGRLLAAAGPSPVFTFRDENGGLHRARLNAIPGPWTATDPGSGLPVWLYVAVHMLTRESFAVVLIAASLLLYLRRPRDPQAMLFAFALIFLCVRSGSLWWWSGSPVPDEILKSSWILGWLTSFLAIASFPDGRFVSRLSKWLAAVLIALAISIPFLIVAQSQLANAIGSSLVMLCGVVAGIAVVLRYRRTPPGAERQQIKWAVGGFCVTLGMLIALVLLEVTQILRDTAGSPVAYVALSLASLICALGVPVGLIVSLLRYRLYDAEATMSRSVAYAALTLSLLAIFAGSEKVIESLGEDYFGGSMGAAAGGIGAALAAVMIAPLHHKLSEWSERRFQQALTRLRRGLPLLVADMRETAALPDLARAVLQRVEAGVRARHAAVLIGDGVAAADGVSAAEIAVWRKGWTPHASEGLDCDAADALFPMRVPLEADGCGRVGWILLGPRPDGSFYGKDEREALAEIADPIARAIAIVREREARQAALDGRIASLEAAVQKLIGGARTANA